MSPEFSVRTESVDVEQIMKQIRQRIRDKRGVDYTEDEIRELAEVKLETFLDPSRVRSELLTYYRQARSAPAGTLIPPAPPNYVFEDEMPYASSPGAGGRAIRLIRKLLNPLLKCFINPNPFIHVLNMQGQINAQNTRRIDHLLASEQLNFEIIHNLVVEMTRLAIEVKNLKMRVESLSGRLDFTERRARSLESVVQYTPGSGPAAEAARGPARVPATSGGQSPRARQAHSQAPSQASSQAPSQAPSQGQSQDQSQGQSQGQSQAPSQGPSQAPSQSQPQTPAQGQGQGQGGVIKGEAQRARRRRRRPGRGAAGAPQAGGGPEGSEPQADARASADGLNFDEPSGGDSSLSGEGGREESRGSSAAGSDEPTDQ